MFDYIPFPVFTHTTGMTHFQWWRYFTDNDDDDDDEYRMLLNKSKNSTVSRNRLSYIPVHGGLLPDWARNIRLQIVMLYSFFTFLE